MLLVVDPNSTLSFGRPTFTVDISDAETTAQRILAKESESTRQFDYSRPNLNSSWEFAVGHLFPKH